MPPPKATTNLLKQLRALMHNTTYVNEPIHAYIVPSSDAHNGEYLADCDKYREFISGFTGSAGTAVITENNALLWTDGRYYLQASEELDENWTLMKDGIPTTPTEGLWLSRSLPKGSRVGVDPKVFSYNKFTSLQLSLEVFGHKLIPVTQNLVKLVWSDRPYRPTNQIKPLGLQFSGKTIKEKFDAVHNVMREKNAKYLVLTHLDEIAWFLNLRGSDISFNPVFFSYVVISLNFYNLYLNPKQLSEKLKQHLNDESQDIKYIIEPYENVVDHVKTVSKDLDGYIWISNEANYALASLIPKKSLLAEITPIQLMKSVKNPVEIEGMKNAHIKDAVALCCYFNWLEKNVASGKITEISGAKKLEEFRREQADFMGNSFQTISSVGPHGAIIHYDPNESTNVPITNETLYLCDSGGQYKDGTTDVTRTFHFGIPTEHEKVCYTRVLKGQLGVAASFFPCKAKGYNLDSIARQFLWSAGLDYPHRTGHGIGSYLCVHEGPIQISFKASPDDPVLQPGMFISNEPGYYEKGQFGIRIEDIVQVVEAKTPHNFEDTGYLTFETVTFVPKQTKLIMVDMLTNEEIRQLNDYHQLCRSKVGPVLEKQKQIEVKEWLWRETEPIKN